MKIKRWLEIDFNGKPLLSVFVIPCSVPNTRGKEENEEALYFLG